jgi:hypothetical protein
MKKSSTIWATAIAVTLLTAPAYALTINDPGVVGAASGETGGDANVATATAIAQHLLDMAASTTDLPGCDIDGTTTCYETSSTEYAGAPSTVLTGGVRVDGGSTDVSGFTYVLAKYNGNNAGFVLFYVPTFGNTIPQYPATLWTDNRYQYGLSNFTGWNGTSVPDGGATLILLGAALGGLGVVRRRMKA